MTALELIEKLLKVLQEKNLPLDTEVGIHYGTRDWCAIDKLDITASGNTVTLVPELTLIEGEVDD